MKYSIKLMQKLFLGLLITIQFSACYKEAQEKYIKEFGESKIEFTTGSNGELSVLINTQRLNLCSANESEIDEYYQYI